MTVIFSEALKLWETKNNKKKKIMFLANRPLNMQTDVNVEFMHVDI